MGSIFARKALYGSRATTDDAGEIGERKIGESVRIGISRDADRVLRFYLRGSPFVSGAKSLNE